MRPIGAVVLAAGASRRFGTPKQLLQFRGSKLLCHAVYAATNGGCAPVIVVEGALGNLAKELSDTRVEVVRNPEWERGIGTSVRTGVNYLLGQSADVHGVVVLTCDQPLIDAGVIAALLMTAAHSGIGIIASRYANTLGIPAYFSRNYFDALRNLADDAGAKSIILSHPEDVVEVICENGAIDIDTPADFDSLINRPPASHLDL